MRAHDHEADDVQRPPGARVAMEPTAWHRDATLSGRPDLLDASAVLGLQRAAGNAAVASLLDADAEERSPVHDVVGSGGGQPLTGELREEMQDRLGHDFSDVRIHTDSAAHESARAVNAHAYTVGHDVVFQRDRFDPSSTAGKTMLAHELTHVVQQRSGPVDGADAGGGIRVSDPSDRFEREASANAERVMAQPAVQRHAEGEEEEQAEG
ncbi:DUF4157 domain-containing protein [Nakamurella flava]|uniref:DUF4157 domain-containing protein n=1 Tax=Nakamurella flava TaxID=2576308 RepID=A0A4U6QDT2_9ACTN|nr:DUF4157 domain-containing protein [Nakamurella flava]TKV58344.1 DUF4157 domain-containing protein [Nakamurella flava]